MIPTRTATLICLCLAATGVSPAAWAEDEEKVAAGRLTAFACGVLPAPTRVQIEAQEDTEAFRRLKSTFLEALRKNAVEIAATAPLKASLYVEAKREGGPADETSLQDPVPEISPPTRRARVRLYSNRRDSLIGGARPNVLTINEMQVAITIHDRSNGRCIWQGEAVHAIDGHDEFALAGALIDRLTRLIGKSVKAAPIRLN